MISESIEFREIDGERYCNLLRLVLDDADGASAPDLTSALPPGLLLLSRDGRVVMARHSVRGRLDLATMADDAPLAEKAARVGARWAVAGDGAAIEAAAESAAAAMRLGEDMADFGLHVGRALQAELDAGRLELWPDLLEGVRLPDREALDRVFDIVMPPRSTVLFYVFDGPRLYAELICARGSRDITVVAGHDALRAGPPPRRWQAGYKELLEEADRRFGPPALGVFVSLDAARAIVAGKRRGELSRALARKELIIDPMPVWLAGPLGVAAVRGAVEAGRKARDKIAERMKPTSAGGRLAGRMAGRVASRVKSSLQKRLRDKVPDSVEQTVGKLRRKADLAEILGFDPFVVAGRFFEIWHPPR